MEGYEAYDGSSISNVVKDLKISKVNFNVLRQYIRYKLLKDQHPQIAHSCPEIFLKLYDINRFTSESYDKQIALIIREIYHHRHGVIHSFKRVIEKLMSKSKTEKQLKSRFVVSICIAAELSGMISDSLQREYINKFSDVVIYILNKQHRRITQPYLQILFLFLSFGTILSILIVNSIS